eukprot:CAMPEP_0170642094 /NCGR_PEP_ID=MMETSP0224-20130122/41139_1 /TAXON_ID=285029 /ORGANISM="Togula jolla, Strain CCCM 725" /LENGTH=32 /DNA_ID= /DNA_START= /DNA_END= /DNA_ORIENTATION=
MAAILGLDLRAQCSSESLTVPAITLGTELQKW